MIKIKIPDMDLAQICGSGQVFRMWRTDSGRYALIARRDYLEVEQAGTLALAEEEELRECGLGYRSRYLRKCAEAAAGGALDLECFPALSYEEAGKELQKLYGVGVKVAECVCLYALHHVDAFPIDTHIGKILERHYPDGFPLERYPGCAGILQQYMFYYDLSGEGAGKGRRSKAGRPFSEQPCVGNDTEIQVAGRET